MRHIAGRVVLAALLACASEATLGAGASGSAQAPFVEDARYKVGTYPGAVYAADLDGDRDLDIVAGNQLSGNVSVLLNSGDGTYVSSERYAAQWPSGIRGADLDGEGDVDLMVTSMQADQVLLLVNQGDATFRTGGTFAVGPNPSCLALVDMDGDKDTDCVAGWGRRDQAGGVSVLLNDGSGTFSIGGEYATSRRVVALYAGDLDGDGDPDVAAANSDDNYGVHADNVSVLLNKGDGSLSAAVAYPLGGDPQSLAGADLNGDGYADLIANARTSFGGRGADQVVVFLNQRDGSFPEGAVYEASAACSYVAAADFDGDEDVDVVTANGTSDSISVFLNNGDGTLAARVDYPVQGGPGALCTGDLDRDGDVDLAVALSMDNRVAVLLNGGRQTTDVGKLEISLVTLDFGEVLVGQSADSTVTAFNVGQAAVVISSISTQTGSFTVSPDTAALEPGSRVELRVRYTASGEGIEADTLTLLSDDPVHPELTLPLIGRGVEPSPQPRLNLEVPEVDFGKVLIGQARDTTLILSNVGDAPLWIFEATTGTERFAAAIGSMPIAPGENGEIYLTFSPTGAQVWRDTLVVGSNDPANVEIALPLYGRGTLPALRPQMAVSESAIAFGGVMIGQSREHALIVSNPGDGVLFVERAWTAGGWFELSDTSLYVDPGSAWELRITFAPTSEGLVRDTLALISSDPDTVVRVALSGKGTPAPRPSMRVSPSALDFGDVPLHVEEPVERTFQVANLGESALQVGSISVDLPQFEVLPASLTLAPGEREFVLVTFSPDTEGPVEALLTIESNDPQTPTLVMPLFGRAVSEPQLELSQAFLDFDTTPLGMTSTRTIVLSNAGTFDLVVDTLETTHPAFTVEGVSFPVIVRPAEEVDIAVAFRPETEGPAEGLLRIHSSDPHNPVVQLLLSGRAKPLFGVGPNPFGTETRMHLVLPQSASVTVKVYNVLGQRIKTLVEDLPAGYQSVLWDGTDDGGSNVSSGVYVCRMSAKGQSFWKQNTLRVLCLRDSS